MKLIIFTGSSATGKSSFTKKISQILNIIAISKDEFKIKLFEKYGFSSHEEKRILSKKAEDIMYKYIKYYININQNLIIDNNFKNFDRLREIINNTSNYIEIICIYCFADYAILAKRYNERIENKNRHEALYILNQYPIINGITVFHNKLSEEIIYKLQQENKEYIFGDKVFEVNTDYIEYEFMNLCKKIIKFIVE